MLIVGSWMLGNKTYRLVVLAREGYGTEGDVRQALALRTHGAMRGRNGRRNPMQRGGRNWRRVEGEELSESSVEIPYSRNVPLHDSHALVDVPHASIDRLIGLPDGTDVRPNPRG
jgi:hypothetical protein